ncbi:MAG: GntR family transcriptional regulator [Lentisphaerae bacterium]|nr:GntR family transcriptional regulator [Lentisphaerota bacterium]
MAILQNEVAKYLLGLIEQGNHSDELPSQNELRRLFNCSTVTVRKAIEKLEERGLVYRIQGKGCFIRRPDQTPAMTRIFLIMPQGSDVKSEFVSSLLNASRKYSYHTIFFCYDGNEDLLFYELDRVSPQVVIWLAPSMYQHGKTLARLLSTPRHVILFNREYEHNSVSFVSGDFVGDGFDMGETLAAHGVRNVLYLSLNMQFMFSQRRYEGLAAAIRKNNGSIDILDARSIMAEDNSKTHPGSYHEELEKAARNMLQGKKYDAIVGAQGELWQLMAKLATEHYDENNQLFLATFNTMPGMENIKFPLIAMDQPIAMMADEAIKLVSRLRNGGAPEQLRYKSNMFLYRL